MIRINQLKIPVDPSLKHAEAEQEAVLHKAARILKVPETEIGQIRIVRRSVDARKKDRICYSYVADASLVRGSEDKAAKRASSPQVTVHTPKPYQFPDPGPQKLSQPPVVVGTGPAGLFCGYMLAAHGYRPILFEQGEDVDARIRKVNGFWQGGGLDPRANVQFGEGGAGTFSDGKLNTMVKDPDGRGRKTLEILAEHGADSRILCDAKPHVGTDVLGRVVKSMRQEIIRMGGEVRFLSRMADFEAENGRITRVILENGESIPVQALVLAIGHSARDTFELLYRRGIPMEAKAFAVGLRIQHPQAMIDVSQYGEEGARILDPASYKLTHQTRGGRGVYSFCMCPGGYVVNASSEEGRLAVNGMSYHDRAGVNANSALIVTVTPADFPDDTPLGGIGYQRRLEELAFSSGQGDIPVQLYGDFREGRDSSGFGQVAPQFKGKYRFAPLHQILPAYLSDSLREAVEAFDGKIAGFSRPDAILAGIESRTSSPVRIVRNSHFESELAGLFPCGEGAGYAGGITSAAMDGIRVAEEIAGRYQALC